MRILVTGANGNLGRLLIQRLDEAALGCRALVRSERAAATVRALPHPPEIVIVDYGDPGAVARAADGCDAVVHLVGILKETPNAKYPDAHEATARAIRDASKRAGFRRVIYLSILGAGPDSPNECLGSKGRAEQILLEPPLETTVLRVPMVVGGDDYATTALQARARARRVRLVRGGASLEQPIDARDVVGAIVAALRRPELAGEAIDLAGPESLPRRELILRAARIVGNEPQIGSIPLAAARLFAALGEHLLPNPPLTRPMLEVLEHDDQVDPAPACARLGIELTPLDDTVRRCLEAEEKP